LAVADSRLDAKAGELDRRHVRRFPILVRLDRFKQRLERRFRGEVFGNLALRLLDVLNGVKTFEELQQSDLVVSPEEIHVVGDFIRQLFANSGCKSLDE